MKPSSFRYLTREGFRNIWQNRFMAIASIGVLVSCLLLTGGAYLVYANVNHIFEWAQGQNEVVAFAKETCTAAQTADIQKQIEATDNVKSVQFISKEDLLEKYKSDLPEATYKDMQGENNPCLDTFVITFKDMSKFSATLKQIQNISNLDSVNYDADIAVKLTRIRNVILSVGGGVIILLLLVSLFIIANTIKLTVYNRRLEISIMKSVGATNSFIRIPFIIEGVVLGLFAGGLAYGIIYLIYSQLSKLFTLSVLSGLISFTSVWPTVLGGFMAIGILTGIAGSALSMSRYLKDEGGISGVL